MAGSEPGYAAGGNAIFPHRHGRPPRQPSRATATSQARRACRLVRRGAFLMSVSKTQVLDELRRVKGPDLEGNIVDLGLVSEILLRDDRVYFSITVPATRAEELEPLRKAAEKVVSELAGVAG